MGEREFFIGYIVPKAQAFFNINLRSLLWITSYLQSTPCAGVPYWVKFQLLSTLSRFIFGRSWGH